MPLGDFLKRFSSERQCREYLASLRWQSGYICPKCGCRHGYQLSNGWYQCAQCRHQVSVTAGTGLYFLLDCFPKFVRNRPYWSASWILPIRSCAFL
ncbi:MAG: transposase [Oscillospiraceae bacterium]|nr:transposase [Oscillospiraceae bacterium]